MRTTQTGFLLALLILAPGLAAQDAAPPPPDGQGGQIFVGTRGLDNNNHLGQVGEYDAARQGLRPSAGVEFWKQSGSVFFDGYGEWRGDARDQYYKVDVQATRYVRIRSHFMKYLHRLDHDPLLDLDTALGGPMVQHTDNDPHTLYKPGYEEARTDVEAVIPGATWLRLKGSHRTYLREGGVQHRTMSKCSTCHVTGNRQEIDQRSHELTGGVAIVTNKVTVDYEYYNRQFNDRALVNTILYDRAIHPVTQAPVFDARVQFDSLNGELPYLPTPPSRKARHSVRARAELPKESTLQAAFTSASTQNNFTGLKADSWGWNARYTIPVNKKMSFSVRAKQLDWEVDDVFVNVIEREAVAGPNTGNTYPEAYPDFGEASFTRFSSRNRNDISVRGELTTRLARFNTLRTGYQFAHRKRDHYEVEKTNTNSVYATYNRRIRETGSGDWSLRARYRFDHNDNPWLHRHAALPPVMQPFESPGNAPFGGVQYFEIYAARQADLTRFPKTSHFIEPSLTWMPNMKFSATLHYRYRQLENDDLNMSEWSRSVHMPGAELYFAPLERLSFTAAYMFHNERSETLFGIPVYDG